MSSHPNDTEITLRSIQAALRESEARCRALFDHSPLPAWLYDLETLRIFTVNDAAVRHYGYSREELLQMTVKDLMPPDDVAALVHHVRTAGAGPRSFRAWRNRKKDGTVINVEVTSHPFALGGRPARLVVVQDTTERRLAEEALRASEEQMRLLLDSAGEGIYGIDLSGNCTLANAACVRMLGYRDESELLGRNVHEIAHHTRENRTSYPVEECRIYQSGLRDDGAIFDDETLWRKDGSSFPAEIRSFPLLRGGKRVGGVVSFVDITARKKAEEATRLLADLVRASWEAIIVTDPAGLITSWNPSAERMFEYAAEEVLGKSITTIVPPDRMAEVDQLLAQLERGGLVEGIETVRVRKDGRRIDVSLTLTFIRNADGTVRGISGVNRDITERRAAEEQVRLLHNIVLAAGEAVTLDETLEVVLRLICQATGVLLANAWVPGSRDKLERRGQWARPEYRERFRPLVDGWSFDKGIGLPGRVWAAKAPVWIANLAVADNFPRAAAAAELGLRAGVAVPILVGEEVVAVIEAFLPQPGEENPGLIALLSAVAAQIGSVVRRRRVEEALRKSEEQFRQAQKMEAVGQLTGGVAHDFNNLLSVILSYSTLIAEALPSDDPNRADLLEIQKAAQRASALTHQLLAFSRRQVLQPRVVDLNKIVAGMEPMLRRLIGEDVELAVVASKAPARVNVDPGQMEQVVLNLAVNARDAMPTGGRLTIELDRVDLDDAFAAAHAGAVPGRHVMLAVSDTGCGMDAATQARVFEPFFTTKEQGKGTGLGLATVFGIVRQSAGTVWLYSEKGKGTSFKIYLPDVEAEEEPITSASPEPAKLKGTETILLLEDEEGVRKLVRSILERNGYRVLEARDGVEALDIARRLPALDLLLTDVVMPRMSGAETAARLLEMRPGLKRVYMSGYTDNAVVLHGVLRSEAAFVQKPITPAALLAKVREVLDSPAAPQPL